MNEWIWHGPQVALLAVWVGMWSAAIPAIAIWLEAGELIIIGCVLFGVATIGLLADLYQGGFFAGVTP